MSIRRILATTDHRPWPLPQSGWSYYQEWNDALFLHWRVDAVQLRTLLPKGFELDLIDGDAWVSVVAFTMERMRPRWLPAFPPISDFHELNVRTYVRSDDKPGVYFLSIEASSKVACGIARRLSILPYRYARIARANGTFRSVNPNTQDRMELSYVLSDRPVTKSPLDRWLTERYALYQDSGTALQRYDTHHVEWPFQEVELTKLDLDHDRMNGLLQGLPEVVHFSPGVAVLAWNPRMT